MHRHSVCDTARVSAATCPRLNGTGILLCCNTVPQPSRSSRTRRRSRYAAAIFVPCTPVLPWDAARVYGVCVRVCVCVFWGDAGGGGGGGLAQRGVYATPLPQPRVAVLLGAAVERWWGWCVFSLSPALVSRFMHACMIDWRVTHPRSMLGAAGCMRVCACACVCVGGGGSGGVEHAACPVGCADEPRPLLHTGDAARPYPSPQLLKALVQQRRAVA